MTRATNSHDRESQPHPYHKNCDPQDERPGQTPWFSASEAFDDDRGGPNTIQSR